MNLAARLASITEPSQFLVTDEILRDVDMPPEVVVLPLGPRSLKGLSAPVMVTAVAPRERGPA